MDGASRYQAIKQANAIVDAYARGNQSLKSMNQALSQHLVTQRSIARNNSKQAKQSGKNQRLVGLVVLAGYPKMLTQLSHSNYYQEQQVYIWDNKCTLYHHRQSLIHSPEIRDGK
ncbi:hypothetical protein H7U18_18375 [Klebsiella pneumoniae]|uniref:Uncharacterized protein n=1 Tax=Klebsiella pneumoniae TaxID=573 RepID=A0A923ERW5_KLEPN|nr:hypothetical protein [Klebsiella pneumoniae]